MTGGETPPLHCRKRRGWRRGGVSPPVYQSNGGRAVETSAPTGQPRICRGDHWSPAVPHMFVRDAFFGRPHRAAPTEFPPYVGETPVIRESVRPACGRVENDGEVFSTAPSGRELAPQATEGESGNGGSSSGNLFAPRAAQPRPMGEVARLGVTERARGRFHASPP